MKKLLVIMLVLVMGLVVVGCGNDNGAAQGIGPGPGNGLGSHIGEDEIVFIVALGYVCNQYVETGTYDGHPLVFFPNQMMFARDGDQYFTLLDYRLRNTPEGVHRAGTIIDDRVQFNSVTVRGGTAYVDIVGDGLHGSSLEESLLISQIVSSLVVSFEEIERVQFLVDGEVAETLMGHIDVSEPFERGIYVTGLE